MGRAADVLYGLMAARHRGSCHTSTLSYSTICSKRHRRDARAPKATSYRGHPLHLQIRPIDKADRTGENNSGETPAVVSAPQCTQHERPSIAGERLEQVAAEKPPALYVQWLLRFGGIPTAFGPGFTHTYFYEREH